MENIADVILQGFRICPLVCNNNRVERRVIADVPYQSALRYSYKRIENIVLTKLRISAITASRCRFETWIIIAILYKEKWE